MFLYSFVSVSPMLKLPLQHPADNPFLAVILYTQTLLEGVIILLPLFEVITAVTSALPACLYEKLFETVTLMLPALRPSHLTLNCDVPAWSPVNICGTLTETFLLDTTVAHTAAMRPNPHIISMIDFFVFQTSI